MKILDFCEGVPIPPRQLLWFSVKGLHFRSLGTGVMQKDKLFLWIEKINKKRKSAVWLAAAVFCSECKQSSCN